MNIGNNHYPELNARMIFLRANYVFRLAYRVFSLWAHKRAREKFLLVSDLQDLQKWYHPEELPEEFGGRGWRLNCDGYIRDAVNRYDRLAEVPQVPVQATGRTSPPITEEVEEERPWFDEGCCMFLGSRRSPSPRRRRRGDSPGGEASPTLASTPSSSPVIEVVEFVPVEGKEASWSLWYGLHLLVLGLLLFLAASLTFYSLSAKPRQALPLK